MNPLRKAEESEAKERERKNVNYAQESRRSE
jgi:hypothetical protein